MALGPRLFYLEVGVKEGSVVLPPEHVLVDVPSLHRRHHGPGGAQEGFLQSGTAGFTDKLDRVSC